MGKEGCCRRGSCTTGDWLKLGSDERGTGEIEEKGRGTCLFLILIDKREDKILNWVKYKPKLKKQSQKEKPKSRKRSFERKGRGGGGSDVCRETNYVN